MEGQTKRHYSSLPVDSGWAWFVMLGAFLNTLFHFTFLRSLSIFFIEFLDKFQQSATVTTLAFGLNTTSFMLGAVMLEPVFLSRFSVRFVTLLGSFITVTSIIGMAFSPNIICLTIMFLFMGFAHPLIFVSQVTLLGKYFKRRLSFAVAFANLGLSGGLMIGPYVTRVLLDEYGLTGSLLIHGGMNFNLFVACMLFRPPTSYTIGHSINEFTSLDDCSAADDTALELPVNNKGIGISSLDNNSYNIVIQVDASSIQNNLENDHLTTEQFSNSINGDSAVLCHPRIKTLQQNRNGTLSLRSTSLDKDISNSLSNSNSSLIIDRIGTGRQRTVSEICIQPENNGKIKYHTGSEMCIRSTLHSKSSITHKSNKQTSTSKRSKSILDFMSSSKSVQYLTYSTIYLDRLFTSLSELKKGVFNQESQILTDVNSQTSPMLSVEIVNDETLSGNKDNLEITSNQNCCCSLYFLCCCHGKQPPSHSSTPKSPKQKSVCFHPLGIMLLLLAGIGVNTQCATAYMPSLGKDQGLSTDQLPILMTIIGAVDLGKLVTGYFADKGYVRRIHIVLFCQLFMGISFQFSSYFQGFEAMVVLCVITGLNTGVLHILLPGITVDTLGPDYIGQVMSGYFLINGAVMTTTHILVGFLKDTTGSFVWAYNFLGCLVLFGGLVAFMEPVFVRVARRIEQK